MVFAFHYGSGQTHNSHIQTLFSFGWSGVDLFFVLSGFLITGILHDTRTDPAYYENFYARRALRIFPVFYLFAAVMFAVGSHWKFSHLSLLFYVGWPVELIWPGAVLSATVPVIHLWSLSLEEQFYMVWPLLMKTVRRPIVLCVAGFTLAISLRILILVFGVNENWAYGFLLCRTDGLMVGAAIALLWRSQKEALQAWAPFGFAVAALGVLLTLWLNHATHRPILIMVQLSLIALTYGALLVLALSHPKIFSLSILRMFSRYSYGMYLFHLPLMVLLAKTKPVLSWMYLPVCLSLNLGIAAASFHFLEQPILRLKNRFSYLNAASPANSSLAEPHPDPVVTVA